MSAPLVLARMKDPRVFTRCRITKHGTRAFAQRARHARQGEVLERGRASCASRFCDRRETWPPAWPGRAGSIRIGRRRVDIHDAEASRERAPRSWGGRGDRGGRAAFGTETKERQKLCKLDQAFRFGSFIGGQRLSLVLLVEQRLKSAIKTFRQAQPREIRRHLEIDVNRHAGRHAEMMRSARRAVDAGDRPAAAVDGDPQIA